MCFHYIKREFIIFEPFSTCARSHLHFMKMKVTPVKRALAGVDIFLMVENI